MEIKCGKIDQEYSLLKHSKGSITIQLHPSSRSNVGKNIMHHAIIY